MEQYQTWLGEKLALKCVQNLKKHGFDAHFAVSGEEALKIVLKLVDGCETFGFGGSSTTREIGLMDAIQAAGKTIFEHWHTGQTKVENMEARLQMGRSDCFVCSANAVAMTGEIVNTDGAGNRITAMTFGPKKVVIIAGINKLTPDLASALQRVRDVAGPMRAKSLGRETPCAETGICSDCNSPQRICNATVILHRRPSLVDMSVVLVNQSLGF